LKVAALGEIPIYTFSDFFHFLEIFVLRTYDMNLQKAPKRILDIGANVGMYSLRCIKLYPESQILAFEPVASNFQRLRENMAGKGKRGCLRNQGVSNKSGSAEIHLHPVNSGAHSLFALSDAKGAQKETIQLVNINDIVTEINAPIDVMKLDCEGAEEAIIMGLSKQNAARIGAMVIEPMFGLYARETFLERLSELGFEHHFQNGLLVATKKHP